MRKTRGILLPAIVVISPEATAARLEQRWYGLGGGLQVLGGLHDFLDEVLPDPDQAGVAGELPGVEEVPVRLDQLTVDIVAAEVVRLDLLVVFSLALGQRRNGEGQESENNGGCTDNPLHGVHSVGSPMPHRQR